MSKISLLLGLIFLFSQISKAQTENQKVGGYFSFNSFKINSPEVPNSFEVNKRSDFDVKMVAGNRYKISSSDIEAKSKIKNDIWGIFHNDTLFVNGKFINGCSHYCKVENKGLYLYMTGELPKAAFSKKYGFKRSMIEHYPSYSPGGAIGGAITGAQLAMIKVYYLLDANTGEISLLTRDNLLKAVQQPDSSFKDQLIKCEPNYNPDYIIKYLNLLNETNSITK
jgi:hypothetical protein